MTPPATLGTLEGITKNTVINIARKKQIAFREAKFKLGAMFKASECFLTGTAAEIVPVVKVDGRKIGNGKPGRLTYKLMEEFRKRTKIDGVRY